MTVLSLLSTILPSLLVGLVLAVFNRRQNKREAAMAKRAEDRRRESLLSLKLAMANGKLSYAAAMAIKRGYANGEVEEGIIAYEQARKAYLEFINEQAAQHMSV